MKMAVSKKGEVGSAEVYFAKKLANNDKKIRDRSVKRLKLWISSKVKAGSALEEADMLKLWKGLFYCMWFSDKPFVQEELAENLSKILYLFNPPSSTGIRFAKVFFVTMGREWYGIDRLRLDKFYLLIKKYIEATFQYLGNSEWDETLVKETSTFLTDLYMSEQYPDGLKIHFGEYAIEEFVKACENSNKLPDDSTLLCLLEPFFCAAAFCRSQSVERIIRTEVLMKLFTLNVSIEDDDGNTTKLNVPFTLVADRLFALASNKGVLTSNRKKLFVFTNKYRKHVTDIEATNTAGKKKKKRKKKKVTNISDPVIEINSDVEVESFDIAVSVTATKCNAETEYIAESAELLAEPAETEPSAEMEPSAEIEPSGETENVAMKKKRKRKRKSEISGDSDIIDLNIELMSEGNTVTNIDMHKSSDCNTVEDTRLEVETTTDVQHITKIQNKDKKGEKCNKIQNKGKKEKKCNSDLSDIVDTNVESFTNDVNFECRISNVICLSGYNETLLHNNHDSVEISATENPENITPVTETKKKKIEVIDIEAHDLVRGNNKSVAEVFIIDEGKGPPDEIIESIIEDSDQDALIDLSTCEKYVISDEPCAIEDVENSTKDATDSVIIEDEGEVCLKEVVINDHVNQRCLKKSVINSSVSKRRENETANDDDIMFQVEKGVGTAVIDLTLSSEENENSNSNYVEQNLPINTKDNFFVDTADNDDTDKNTDNDDSMKSTDFACKKTLPFNNILDDNVNRYIQENNELIAGDIAEGNDAIIDNEINTTIENIASNDEIYTAVKNMETKDQQHPKVIKTVENITDSDMKEKWVKRNEHWSIKKKKRNSYQSVPVSSANKNSTFKKKKERSNYFDPVVADNEEEDVYCTLNKKVIKVDNNMAINGDRKEVVNEVSVNLIEINSEDIADSENINIGENDAKISKKKKRKSLLKNSVSKNKTVNATSIEIENNSESVVLSNCINGHHSDVTEQTFMDDVKTELFSNTKQYNSETKDDCTAYHEGKPYDVVSVDAESVGANIANECIVNNVKKSNKRKRRKSKLAREEKQAAENNKNKNIDGSMEDCIKDKVIVNNTVDNYSVDYIPADDSFNNDVKHGDVIPSDVTSVDEKSANECIVKNVKKSNKKKRKKSKLSNEEKQENESNDKNMNIDSSLEDCIKNKVIVNNTIDSVDYIPADNSFDNCVKHQDDVKQRLEFNSSGLSLLTTSNENESSGYTQTKRKQGKRKKSLREEDIPKPIATFVKGPAPAAFYRKALTKIQLLKRKTLKPKVLSTPQSEPGKKKVRIELRNNISVADKDFKVSPMPAFSPTRKPVKSSIKVTAIKRRRRASDFF